MSRMDAYREEFDKMGLDEDYEDKVSAYTPGPWNNEDYEITAGDGSVICSVNSIDDFPCIDEDNSEEGMEQLVAEFEANASLIAAAPRMYAFIEFCAAVGNAEAKAILEEINGRI